MRNVVRSGTFLLILLLLVFSSFWTQKSQFLHQAKAATVITTSDTIQDLYINGDAEINGTVIVQKSPNWRLTVTGTLTINGKLDYTGGGKAGPFASTCPKGGTAGQPSSLLDYGGAGGNAGGVVNEGNSFAIAGSGGGGFWGGGGGGRSATAGTGNTSGSGGGGAGFGGVGGDPYGLDDANGQAAGGGTTVNPGNLFNNYILLPLSSTYMGYGGAGGKIGLVSPTCYHDAGGRGGGGMIIEANKLVLNGDIISDGQPGLDAEGSLRYLGPCYWTVGANPVPRGGGGGGAGGGIIIKVNELVRNSGGIYARGGRGGRGSRVTDRKGICGTAALTMAPGGGGGGGIVLVYANSYTNFSEGDIDVSGGPGGDAGAAGGNNGGDGQDGFKKIYLTTGLLTTSVPFVTVEKRTYSGSVGGCSFGSPQSTFDAGDWVCVKATISNPGGSQISGLKFYDEVPGNPGQNGIKGLTATFFDSSGSEVASQTVSDYSVSGSNPATLSFDLPQAIPASGRAEVTYRYQLPP